MAIKEKKRGMELDNGGNMMQERQYSVLRMLYNSEGFVTAESLAEEVCCSLKTIRNDLKHLDHFLQESGLGTIISKSKKGIYLEGRRDWAEVEHAWKSQNKPELYGQDCKFQILELLLKQKSIQKMKMEQMLLISRLDAERAANQAVEWLDAHGIAVTCRRGQGIQAECSEYAWRLAMWELFAEISLKRQEFTNQALKSQTEKFLWGFDMAGVTRTVSSLEDRFQMHFSFDGYQQLVFLLSLSVIRIRKKETVSLPVIFQYEGMELDKAIAAECIHCLEDVYKISFSEYEAAFVRMVLGVAEIQDFSSEASREGFLKVNDTINRVVEKLISVTGNILRQNLEEDAYLHDNLLLYLKSKTLKLRYGIQEENPLKEIVKSKYPNIYAAAWSTSLILESELGIQIGENEISYLALYIGGAIERLNVGVEVCILCNHGIGVSRILKEQIERSIQNINIVDVLTTRDTLKIQKSQCDFLISSVPVGGVFAGKDVVQIENMLQPWDIQLIQKKMKQIRKRKMRRIADVSEDTQYQLFHEEFIYDFHGKINKKDLISFLCKKLSEAGYVTAGYEKTVYEREETTSTVLDFGVAIPHGAANEVCRPVIAVAIMEEPVDWGRGRTAERVFLLALNLDERFHAKNQIIRFYSAIVSLMEDKDSYGEFYRLDGQAEIAEYLNIMVKGDR